MRIRVVRGRLRVRRRDRWEEGCIIDMALRALGNLGYALRGLYINVLLQNEIFACRRFAMGVWFK